MATTSTPRANANNSVINPDRQGHAGFLDYIGVAFDSLRSNKLRSFLTLLGITIGITSIIAVISLIQGMDRYWKTKVSNFGPNTFVVTQYPIITDFDKFLEAVRRNPEVHSDDADRLRRLCPACEAIGVETHRNVTVRYGHQSLDTIDMGGLTANISEIEGKKIDLGRDFLDWEDDHSRFVTVIGSDIADRLFPGLDPLDKEIQIDDHWYTVIGVGEKRGSVFGFSQDNYVKIPLGTYQRIYGARRTVNISVKGREGQLQEAEDQVRLAMRTLHKLNYHDEDDFGIITAEGVNQLFATLTSAIFSVSIFVVGISLIVGGIVIMNIMLVSVVERTKEIGIRKAVGARQQDVVNQFLVESVVLCCAGGAAGVLIAALISWALATFTPMPSSFPLWAPFVAFILCTIIGVFFGIYPARRAGRLDPIEALRVE